MAVKVRGVTDNDIDQVLQALANYEAQHPQAKIEVYRQNSASIRIRIIDADFTGVDRSERHEQIWRLLESLPDELQSQVSLLLLLAPNETERSFANMEFDNSVPSRL